MSKLSASTFVNEVFDEVQPASEITAETLHIWGGDFSESQLTDFLALWTMAVPSQPFKWRMVEEVGRFYVESVSQAGTGLNCTPFELERLRLFGSQGDLDIQRDGDRFRWRFLGEVATNWPTLADSPFSSRNFWNQAKPAPQFCAIAEKYYQWRRTDDEHRVTNWLPENSLKKEGVILRQIHYLDNGRIAFVRYVDFVEDKA